MPQLPRFREPWCMRCGVPLAFGRCHCADLSPALDMLRSVAAYDGWLRQAIVSFKYHDEWSRADHLGQLLAMTVRLMPKADGIVPVPLHAKRLRQRGFNQSTLLAQVISRHVGVPVCDLLLRAKLTMQQVGLSAVERHHNVAGAFQLRSGQSAQGARFVLIDDVVTTGSTLGACAEALSQGGASFIGAATLAHDRRPTLPFEPSAHDRAD